MAPATLYIRLFGALDLRLGSQPVSLESSRAESLLAYLLLQRAAPQPRRTIAFLLWPDSTEAQALTNLRHVLHTLRHALPGFEHYIDATPRTLQWRSDAPYELDVATFDAALAHASVPAPEAGELRRAVELYVGELLEGNDDEWLLLLREDYRQRYLDALIRLARVLEARGEHAEAILLAERLLQRDPLDEPSWRLLMRLHNARGDRARALRANHACATTLERELGVEPSQPTREVYEALLAPEPKHIATIEQPLGTIERIPLVGRSEEWQQLTSVWRAAEAGKACCLLVSGDAGSGKTRLVEELLGWCVQRGATAAEGRSYAAEGALAYGPIVAWLRADAIRTHRERINPAARTELARLLPELLAADPRLAHPQPLPEADQRQRLYDALVEALLASGEPLLLVADDLHWSDRETLGFVHYLLRVAGDTRLLIAATARTEELDARPALRELLNVLRADERLTEIELGSLRRDETIALAEQVAGQKLPAPDVEWLVTTTEGNPLFIVEAMRAGRQGDLSAGMPLTPRVHAVLESRLGQLSAEARDLAGIAATIGRAFNTDVLRAVAGADDDELVRALDELWRRRIVREQDIDSYDFSHPLILEVAYRTAGPAQRRQRHARVASALERLHASDPLEVSGQIAAQYAQAGSYDRAVSWYRQAAEARARMYAHEETVRLLERAVELLRTHPIPNRAERELELLSALPGPLLAIEGYRSARLSDAQQRAMKLSDALGQELDPSLLRSLGLSTLSHQDVALSRDFARRLYARGERDNDDVLLVEAKYLLGVAAYWSGEFEEAQRTFEDVARLYRPERRLEHLLRFGQDPYVICQMRLAHTLWFLGYPDSAAKLRDETLALAETAGHLYSHAVVHTFAVLAAIEMREFELVRELLFMPIGRLTEIGAHHIQTNFVLFNGLVDVLDGRTDAGIEQIRRLMDDQSKLFDAPGQRSMYARVLLEACRAGNRPETGIAATAAMLDWTHLWDSERLRLRAEFRATLGASSDEILADLTRSLDIATGQRALMPRLRAATSLLRHHLAHSDGAAIVEAQNLLSTVLASLAEGHTTEDVRAAVELLRTS